MIWEREEILRELKARIDLLDLYERWDEERQEEFLDFCTGVRGIKFLYDSFFKELMNPEYAPERLNDFLSVLLQRKVRLVSILPNDSTRIADESSLLVTDIVVELDDGSLANVEVQKIGYYFPGARSACYSADLLLRQYKRLRGKYRNKFTYRDIKNVYTVVLFEKSLPEFHAFPDTYLHYFEQRSDTGLKMDLLQKYYFLPLDIFRKNQHNKNVENKLDAWLTFFCMDDPEDIIGLIENYPEFRQMYYEAYSMCRNLEEIMSLFSAELKKLDQNTVQLMIDDMEKELERKGEELNRTMGELERKGEELDRTVGELERTAEALERTGEELELKRKALAEKDSALAEKDSALAEKDSALAEKDSALAEKDSALAEKDSAIAEQQTLLEQAMKRIEELEKRIK